MPDAYAVMQLLLKTQTDFNNLDDDDPQVRRLGDTQDCFKVPARSTFSHLFILISIKISYMISAWARMCKILGKDFQQYLPVVMGPLLKTASIKPEVALLDSKLVSRSRCGLNKHLGFYLFFKSKETLNIVSRSPRYGEHIRG